MLRRRAGSVSGMRLPARRQHAVRQSGGTVVRRRVPERHVVQGSSQFRWRGRMRLQAAGRMLRGRRRLPERLRVLPGDPERHLPTDRMRREFGVPGLRRHVCLGRRVPTPQNCDQRVHDLSVRRSGTMLRGLQHRLELSQRRGVYSRHDAVTRLRLRGTVASFAPPLTRRSDLQ